MIPTRVKGEHRSPAGGQGFSLNGAYEQVAGAGSIKLLVADALYADGPLLAWLKYAHGIDALVRLPADRLLYQDVQGLAEAQLIGWTHHRYVRTVRGHKQMREVEVTAAGDLTSWEGFTKRRPPMARRMPRCGPA